jgi:uncharacterized membrane protein
VHFCVLPLPVQFLPSERKMDLVLILARIVHIVAGVYWAGTLFFLSLFLIPALAEAGPGGSPVVDGLERKGFLKTMPISAGLTILAGLYLYWHDARISDGAFMHSHQGMTLGTGAVLAIIGAIMGGSVVGRSFEKALHLSRAAATADASQRESMLAEASAMRMRAASASRIVAVLLLIAVLTMAVARYV